MVSFPRKRESRSQKSYDKTGLLPRAGMTRYTIRLKCYEHVGRNGLAILGAEIPFFQKTVNGYAFTE